MQSRPQNPSGYNTYFMPPNQGAAHPFPPTYYPQYPYAQGQLMNNIFIQDPSFQRVVQQTQKAEKRTKFNGSECIYVGDIDKNTKEEVLREAFSRFGISEIYYPKETYGMGYKGYAFIRFESVTAAREARVVMNGKSIDNHQIRVLEIINPRFVNTEGNIVLKNYRSEDANELQRVFSQYDEIYSLKISPEKKEAYIQFKTLKASEILEKLEKVELDAADGKKNIFFALIDKEKFEIEAFRKKGSLYIRNLPFDDLDEKEFLDFLEGEGRKRKILKKTFGKHIELRKSWGLFKFENYESAKQVFETFQSQEWKNHRLEIFWRVAKKSPKSNSNEIEKMSTGPLRPTVTSETLTSFFMNNISPNLRISVKILTANPSNPNNPTFATVFVHKEDQKKLNEFINEQKDKNMHLLRTVYQIDEKNKIIYSYLIPKAIKEEFVKMKQNAKANTSLSNSQPPVNTSSGYNTVFAEKVQPPVQSLDEYQRLGQLLYPLIFVKVGNHDDLAKKITGMLIDKSVFEIEDVKEFVENPEVLQERIREAIDLLNNSGDN